MLARLHSVTLEGIEGVICEVEVDVGRHGFDRSIIVGLPDAAVKESVERVASAIINSGFKYPRTQALINLAPADVKKVGPGMILGEFLQPGQLSIYLLHSVCLSARNLWLIQVLIIQ